MHEHCFQRNPNLIPLCERHYKAYKRASRILPIVNVVYGLLFIPLMMMPVAGWLVLIVIGNYKERLEGDRLHV